VPRAPNTPAFTEFVKIPKPVVSVAVQAPSEQISGNVELR
jgi:hypothetical protein